MPDLVARGVVPADVAERLRAHYAGTDRGAGARAVVLLFGVLGALLVGGGVILLLAHNWEELSRPARTALSLLPLAASLAVAAWVLATDRGAAWREATAGAWTLAIGSSISLVGQTYHVPGDWPAFLLTWLLLALPVLYLLRSVTASVLYCLGLMAWSIGGDGEPLLFWGFLAAAVPLWAAMLRRRAAGAGAELLVWAAAAAVAVGVLPSLEALAEVFWPPLLGAVFTALWAGSFVARPRRWERPLRIAGGLGLTVLALTLSYAEPWPETTAGVELDGVARTVAQGAAGALLTAGAVALLALAWRRHGSAPGPLAAALPAIWLGWLAARTGRDGLAAATLNLYLLALGAALVASGLRDESLRRANAGTAVVGVLVLLRFFDSDLGFLLRGVAFIAVGLSFLLVNVLLVRRRRTA